MAHKIVKILSLVSLVGSFLWMYAEPDYEPGIAISVSLATLIGNYVVERKRRKHPSQHQNVSGQSIGIQGARDIKIGEINTPARKK